MTAGRICSTGPLRMIRLDEKELRKSAMARR